MKFDLVITGGKVLNVYTGRLGRADICVQGERISYVGPPVHGNSCDMVVDVSGKVVAPGYIDGHFHPWFIYNPVSFGQEACARGITTLFCDNLLFYLVMGLNGFERLMDYLSTMPIKFFWFCRAVPQSPMPDEDELFSVDNIKRLMKNSHVQSLGEITRWPQIIKGDSKIKELIHFTRTLKKRVDGHTAGAKYEQLCHLAEAGVDSCHEAINAKEALERLQLGMYVFLRQSSLRQDLDDLLRIVTQDKVLTQRLILTTDCSSPSFYEEHGILDHLISIALEKGIDPVSTYRMVTINPATYFGMDHVLGGIAPGRFADFVVLEDLFNPIPEMVFSKGRLVAKNSTLIEPFPEIDWEAFFPCPAFYTRNWRATGDLFQIRSNKKKLRFPVIKLISPVITRIEWKELKVSNNVVDLSNSKGLNYISIIDKNGRWVTNGVIEGFGHVYALASSFNTAAQIIAIGTDPGAMAEAVNRVLEIKGGIVLLQGTNIKYEFPLKLGGIMSEMPLPELAKKERSLKDFLFNCGYKYHDPFYTLVFLPNDFLPEVRINYKGIMNIKTGETLWPRRDLAC